MYNNDEVRLERKLFIIICFIAIFILCILLIYFLFVYEKENINCPFLNFVNYIFKFITTTGHISLITVLVTIVLNISVIRSTIRRDENAENAATSNLIDTITKNHSDRNYKLCKIIEEINLEEFEIYPKEFTLFSLVNDLEHKSLSRKEIKKYYKKLTKSFKDVFEDSDGITIKNFILAKSIEEKLKVIKNMIEFVQQYKESLKNDLDMEIIYVYSKNRYVYYDSLPNDINEYLKKIITRKNIHLNCIQAKYIIDHFYGEMRYSLLGIEEVSHSMFRGITDIEIFEKSYMDDFKQIYRLAQNALLMLNDEYIYTIRVMQNYE